MITVYVIMAVMSIQLEVIVHFLYRIDQAIRDRSN